jgi:hypothetical protein
VTDEDTLGIMEAVPVLVSEGCIPIDILAVGECVTEPDIVGVREPRGVPDADVAVVAVAIFVPVDTIVIVDTLGGVAPPYHQRKPDDAVVVEP